MCGIVAVAGPGAVDVDLGPLLDGMRHRGPDDAATFHDRAAMVALGHVRLSILDRSPSGRNPMASPDGRVQLVFNGEIYNYRELRAELTEHTFRSDTDTEVLLAAYLRWGEACLDRLLGMFAFALWDSRSQRLFAARDRFGVKPLHVAHGADGTTWLASEIRVLHQAGIERVPDETTWATYFATAAHEHTTRTFWRGVETVPPGHLLIRDAEGTRIVRWYDVAERVGDAEDDRPLATVQDEYRALLEESVRLRFRADVPVGINVSGGVDSSALLGLVDAIGQGEVSAFTFATGDAAYDEVEWVEQMLAGTGHPWVVCTLSASEVPELAASVQRHQDEPFGGLPTLAYARIFERAREEGIVVLLDGQGMDEQWAGYDYYRPSAGPASLVQGTGSRPIRPECLDPAFLALAEPFAPAAPFAERLRNLQYRDLRHTKIPRALRFNERISMRSSTELREPFLDHRLVELALRQPADRKIRDGVHKWMLRRIVADLMPRGVVEAPKRPLQTPQREWLRGPLAGWATDCIERGLAARPGWLDAASVRREWRHYLEGNGDNSFYVWQWVGLGLALG